MSAAPPLVLVIDDDADTRGGIRELLEASGYAVAEAANGKTAMDLLVSHKDEPRLILLDVQMPVMNGWEFLAIVKSYVRLARIPVVVVSGSEVHPDVVARGAVCRHVPKPIDPDKLMEAVQSCVGPRVDLVAG